MTPGDFAQSLKEACCEGAVHDCVSLFDNPPGRRPRDELKRISHWFKTLSTTDREFVIAAMREASDASVFGVLCIIDGVRVIEPPGEKSEFKLTATRGGVVSQISPSESYLHDLYRSEP